VITNPTNLYLQTDFPEAEQALMFHIGLGVMVAECSRSEIAAEDEEHVSTSCRRYRRRRDRQRRGDMNDGKRGVAHRCLAYRPPHRTL